MADDPAKQLADLIEGARDVKFGRGVIGKTSHVTLGVLAIWAAVIWRLSDNWILDAILVVAGFVASAFAIWWTRSSQAFAKENPAQAMLEGAHLIEYRRLEIQSKNGPSIPGPNQSIDRKDDA